MRLLLDTLTKKLIDEKQFAGRVGIGVSFLCCKLQQNLALVKERLT